MRSLVIAAVIGVMASTCSAAYSQTPSTSPPPSASPPPAAAEQSAPAAASSRRADCRASTQSLKGQDKRDQMQLCIAQARLDCLKQAIDRKVTGPQRRDFVKSCVGGEEPKEQM